MGSKAPRQDSASRHSRIKKDYMKDDMPSEDDSDSEGEYGGIPKFTQIGIKPSALSKV